MSVRVNDLLTQHGGMGYLVIIAVQFGTQPLLAKNCISPGTLTSSLVFSTELVKAVTCIFILSGRLYVFNTWNAREALVASGIPSVTYVVQNYCIQIAYQNLDPVVFNVLNQTKVLFTALFAYLIASRKQSLTQCFALAMVTVAAILVSIPSDGSAKSSLTTKGETDPIIGIGCVLVAAALSGVGSGITEWATKRQRRDNYLQTLEMASIGCFIVMVNLALGLADELAWREGLFSRWTWLTLLPVLSQGLGGIVVGIITKIAGGVQKILATISGLCLTCLLQQVFFGMTPSASTLLGVPLVAMGIYLHATYPPPKEDEHKK